MPRRDAEWGFLLSAPTVLERITILGPGPSASAHPWRYGIDSPRLNYLEIVAGFIMGLEELRFCPTELHLRGCYGARVDFKPVSQRLTKLRVSSTVDGVGVANYSDPINRELQGNNIGALVNLTELELSDHHITSVEELRPLSKLRVLDLSGNAIDDLSPLSCMTELRKLYLGRALWEEGFLDVAALAGLVHLEELGLSRNLLRNMECVSNLKQLGTLYVDNSYIEDLSPLGSLECLEELHLDENRVRDLTPLGTCKRLRFLSLNENRIVDLSPLEGLTELQQLSLYRNPIEDFRPLTALRKLEHLFLGGDVERLAREGVDLSHVPDIF